jgi:hydrogenase expression/formation protein HypE
LPQPTGPLAFTTDSYVVTPLFFPGGDIGELAVYGTVNDLAVMGAVPRWLSLAFIVEEGFPMSDLESILRSIATAANRAEVEIVTGDTKVVPRGAADGIYLNTAGVGEFVEPIPPGPEQIQPGDQLVVSGPIGRHGLAILAARENLGFDPAPQSDCAPVTGLFRALRGAGVTFRAARDATRGGVAAVCHEWARDSRTTLCLQESQIPVSDEVRGATELLGLDPLFLANEGTVVFAVEPGHVAEMLRVLRAIDLGRQATVIGDVRPRQSVPVVVAGRLGRERVLEEPAGAPLPRIC